MSVCSRNIIDMHYRDNAVTECRRHEVILSRGFALRALPTVGVR